MYEVSVWEKNAKKPLMKATAISELEADNLKKKFQKLINRTHEIKIVNLDG